MLEGVLGCPNDQQGGLSFGVFTHGVQDSLGGNLEEKGRSKC